MPVKFLSGSWEARAAAAAERRYRMRMKLKAALLMCLAAAAVYMGGEAYRSLRPSEKSRFPQEIYARYLAMADSAQYYLRSQEGYVAVYRKERDKTPLAVTDIELAALREGDRAMLQEGIPVVDRRELLQLLEDLGS